MTDGSPRAIHASRAAADAPARWRSAPIAIVVLTGAALVVFRALTHLLFVQMDFDSDQAIVGLMAKHLSEGRAFPLFFYGQTYMLGVEAWAAVPFFRLLGPTVESLRLSLLAWNIVCVALLVAAFREEPGLRRWIALVPALFFAAAPPSIAAKLMNAQGGIVEPFVYVPLLWLLRNRPLWFGVVLGIGFRNREFTLYAVPALVAVQILTGNLNRQTIRNWLLAFVAFCAAWETVEALKPFADLAGPGTRGELLGGFAGSQVGNLLVRFDWNPGQLIDRVDRITPALLAWFSGAAQVETQFPFTPRSWLMWAVGAFVLLTSGRLIALLLQPSRTGDGDRDGYWNTVRARSTRAGFGLYLVGVGVIALAAFIAAKPEISGYARYALLGVFLIVGVTGALLALEPRAAIRRAIIAAAIGWTALSLADHAVVLARLRQDPPPDPMGQVADALVKRGARTAGAGYWRAYEITFLAQERVVVASTDFVRIAEYQRMLDERPPEVLIADAPCPGGEQVGALPLYLCPP